METEREERGEMEGGSDTEDDEVAVGVEEAILRV